MPAPCLSVVTNDCISNAKDYNAGGARYNTNYIQGADVGTISTVLQLLNTMYVTRKPQWKN